MEYPALEYKKGGARKDACYHKVKARYSVWPSAYASGALSKCRKVGASNWGKEERKAKCIRLRTYTRISLKHVEDPIETRLFKQICEEFNMQVIDMVLDGKEFSMGNNLSTLSVRRIERNPSKPTIDWWESNNYKQELLAQGKELYNAETGKVRSGLSTTLTPGTVSTTGRSLDARYLISLPTGLPQPEVRRGIKRS